MSDINVLAVLQWWRFGWLFTRYSLYLLLLCSNILLPHFDVSVKVFSCSQIIMNFWHYGNAN